MNQCSPYDFDAVIEKATHDMGRTTIDLVKFRVQHLAEWQTCLDRLREGYDFPTEARALVEKSLLENPERPPVTGTEIIEELGVSPGPEVGRLLLEAKHLFETGVRGKQAILDRL